MTSLSEIDLLEHVYKMGRKDLSLLESFLVSLSLVEPAVFFVSVALLVV